MKKNHDQSTSERTPLLGPPARKNMEGKSKSRQILAGFFSSLSAFCAGCSFVWITPLLVRLQAPGAEVYLSHDAASWVVSLIEVGNFFSPIPGAFLADVIGRKTILLSTGPMYIVTWLLVLFTRSVIFLYIMRLIQGVALGIVYTVLPMYLGEIAEPKLRGALSVMFILLWFLGIIFVYIVGPFVSYQTLTWCCFVPPVIYTLTFWYFPESPYFLQMRKKDAKAAESLAWLRGCEKTEEVEQELSVITNSIQEETKSKASWKDIFTTKVGRKSLLLAQLVAMTQIMGGFTSVLSYATDSLTKSGDDLIDPDMCTIIIGAAALITTVLSALLVDRAGRRPILLASSGGAFITLAATFAYYLVNEEYPTINMDMLTWVPYTTLTLFIAFSNFGLAALLPTLQAELFPTSTRGVASGITALNICIMSFIVLKIYIPIQDTVGLYLDYLIYAVFTALGTVLIAIFLPETKGKSFIEIQELL